MYLSQGQDQSGYHGKVSSGTSVCAGICLSVPPELWFTIFLYLDDKDLRAATRTCSDFRLLAQPLLFRVLDVCPFFLAYNTDRIIYRPRQYLQTTLNRLEYYKSSRIASAVTELWVSPYARNGFPTRHSTDDLDPNLVIEAIIDTLPIFPNLRSLTWHCIDISPNWWTAIQRQSSLSRLWINSSTILPPSASTDETFSARPLKISRLDLDHYPWEGRTTNLVSPHEELLKGVGPVLLSMVILPENIRSISVPRQDTALHLLSILGNVRSDTCHMLLSLTIPFSSTSSEDFVPSLIAATSLKDLNLLAPQEDGISHLELKKPLPPTSLPLLETYQGPYHLLPLFANVHHSTPRKIRSVDLWGHDESVSVTVCDPYRLEAVLEEVSLCKETLSALKNLSATVTHVTIELTSVLSRFPSLEAIFLESQDRNLIPDHSPSPVPSVAELLPTSPISMFYDLLRFHVFSHSLRHLYFITHLKATALDSTTQCVDAAKFLECLGQMNPHLETINVRYGTYSTELVDIKWSRRMFVDKVMRSGEIEISDVEAVFNSIPLSASTPSHAAALQRSSTDSSSSSTSDSSEAAVEKFLSLPSKHKSIFTVHLHIGDMTFTEQRRAVLLPDRLPVPDVGTPGLSWLARGVTRIRYLARNIGKIFGEGVGIARN